jgi:raffinose/stachyose/melibiose transport system substrate-binding protein
MYRSLARLGGLAVVSSLIVVACGGSTPTTAPTAAATAAAATAAAPSAAAPSAAAPSAAAPTAASTEPVSLEFWYWAESDAPGANQWMTDTVAAYKAVKPNVTINVVPQGTDTLISAFQTAAASKSGPDIASQWATGPVLSFVWSDSVAPISDLVPAAEMSHWLNTNENTYNGKVWAMPQYLLGIGLAYNTELFAKAGVTPPTGDRWTWDEFIAASAKLKTAGITPFVGGDKNGYLGAWWFANVGGQQLNSVQELASAVVGTVPFTDPKYTGWYKNLDDYVKAGYVNNDVMSLDLDQGVRLFGQGKGAMTFTSDGMLATAIKDLGAAKVGVMRPPKLGTGTLADAGNATQSISHFVTSWSAHPQDAADFLQFMHTPDRLTAWYKATGVVAADDRFDATLVTVPQLQTMAKAETTGPQVWLENWIPPQIDGDADLPAGQMIFSGSGTPADAGQLWERSAATWRSAHPDELANWQQLVK